MSNETHRPSEIKLRLTDELVPYATNPRTHSDEQIDQIVASIREFGFTNPILVDSTGGIIAGHGRLQAAQRMGMLEVPTIELGNLTETQCKAYVIADNKLSLNAGWNLEALSREMKALAVDDFELGVLGFSTEEMEGLMAAVDAPYAAGADDDVVPEAPEVPVTRLGDVWLLGKHRLICGSSTEAATLAILMEHSLAQMVWTAPPYGVSYVGKTEEALTIQNDGAADISDLLDISFDLMNQRTISGAAVYVAGPSGPGVGLVFSQMMEKHFNYQQQLIWVKNSLVMGRRDYHYRHEPIFYGYTNGHTGRIGRLGASGWYGDHCQTTVLEFDRPTASINHPTMKPVALVAYCLQNSSAPDGIVLDPFGGSGTTLIACEQTGRVCRTVELEPKYCDVIITRWQTLTGLEATNAASGLTFAQVALSVEGLDQYEEVPNGTDA